MRKGIFSLMRIAILLAALVLQGTVSFAASKKYIKNKYLPIPMVSGQDPSIELFINQKSLSLDLSRTRNIRLRLKTSGVRDLYNDIDRLSSIKFSVYEIDGADRNFISSQTLSVSRGSRSRIISVEAGYFKEPTKNIEIDLYDTTGNLINTYATEITALNTEMQVVATAGVPPDTVSCDGSDFGDCQLDYFFDRVRFVARPQRQVSTRVVKGEDGLYKVTLPVPRNKFKFLGKRIRRKSRSPVDGSGSGGGSGSDFGETLNISNIYIGDNFNDSVRITVDNGELVFSGPVNAPKFNGDLIEADVFNGGIFRGTFIGDGSQLTGIAKSNGDVSNITIGNGTLQDPAFNGTINIYNGTVVNFDNGSYLNFDNGTVINIRNGEILGDVINANLFNGGLFRGDGSGLTNLPIVGSNGSVNNFTINNGNLVDPYLQDPVINGHAFFTDNSLAQFNGQIMIPAGAADGLVLTSDANGVATWSSAPSAACNASKLLAPSILSPANGETGVALNTDLVITFGGLLITQNGNITLRNVTDNSTLEIIDVNSSKVSLVSNKVTINPDNDLSYGKRYSILIDNGAFQNVLNCQEDWAGFADDNGWTFDSVGPPGIAVSSRSPGDNATGVSRTANFSVTFNVPVNRYSGNVTFYDDNDVIFDQFDLMSSQATFSNGNRTLTFDPNGTMEYLNGYYLNIDGGIIENQYTPTQYFSGYTTSSVWNFTITGPPNITDTEEIDLPPDTTRRYSDFDLRDIDGSSDTPVANATFTNNRVAGDSETYVEFDTVTNLPSRLTTFSGDVYNFGTDAPIPTSFANRFIVPNQEYSFYVDLLVYKLVFVNEPSPLGIFTARKITGVYRNF